MANQHGKGLDFTACTPTSYSVELDSDISGISPLDAELIEHLLNGDVGVGASSSSSAFCGGAFAHDDGLSELSKGLREQQELTNSNRALKESCAEWVSVITHVLSKIREVTVERDRLMQHITRLADSDHELLQWIQLSQEVHALQRTPGLPDLEGDQFSALMESITEVSASTLAPEVYEVPGTRLSVSPQRRLSAPYHETVFEQTWPTTSFNESQVAMQVVGAREVEHAELMLQQPSGERQEGRRRKRRRRQRRRMDASTSNGQREVLFQLMAQINQEQAQVPPVALHTQHQQSAHLNSSSNRRQLGRRRRRHNLHPSLTYSTRPSSNYVNARLIVDRFPKAARAA